MSAVETAADKGTRSRWRLRPIAFVRARLKNRPDGEHEMILNRLAICSLLIPYLLISGLFDPAGHGAPFVVAVIFTLFAVGFFAHVLWRPGLCVTRRVMQMVTDITALSFGLHYGGEITSILYPAYLWIIFGNGFRFGVPALFTAAALSLAGFGLVIPTTDYWAENARLSYGLLLGLLVLPAYAATLIKKLERARLAAEEANRAKSLFLASVSHELRTPLNAVIGMTDLLESTDLDAEQRDMARTAGASGRSLLELIDALLNFSRLEAGKMPVQITDFDLHDLLASSRGMLAAQARGKHLRLGLHVTPRTPYRLRGEARHIRDVLVNLIGNAVKFTETGGVVASVDLVGGTPTRPRLRFEVADTGIGIATEARVRIFESFTQADETIINSHGGTGLGLAICKQLVELNGGRIGVDSEPGVGSTFWFELDLELASEGFVAVEPAPPLMVALAASEERAFALAAELAAIGSAAEAAVDLRSALRLLRSDMAGGRRVVVIDATGSAADGEAMAGAVRAVDEDHSIEIALIDPALGAGLPDSDVRLLCASSAAAPDRATLGAMVRIASVGAVGRTAAPVRAAADAPSRRLSILVAEDNRTNQKVITKVLERAGHEVQIAENGEFALDALTERAFDLVLMDVNMPVLDGVECTKLYRFASIGKPRTPIVALTADATSDARERCLEAGMDACLTKPIEPEKLLSMIEEICRGAAGVAVAEAERAAVESGKVDDEIVANIARHPGYRPAKRAVVDRNTLAELEQLGGSDFVAELVEEFIGDAAAVLRSLHEAVESRQPSVFREQAHALRSGAANIGARGMYEICLSYRNADAHDLAAHGAEHLRRLESEFERVRKTLRRRFPDRRIAKR
ncbi:hybrid sensor histidine kinase/response regulator [Hansschlegelia zhihuaiae]|uniref:Sensory/regulatory protein RpfC n=1 Tax=Hansschlegelia zhihuaiae TaxID=405005 RepID=A0A4Q0MFT1_9HYPH|nr:response regulator [Hansschlegelia zhihuaiae]RXF72063.1 response regulator [Hansschlegelia zhihuaiae]